MINPLINFNTVVFPEPELPMIVRNSPFWIYKLKSFSISRSPYDLLTCSKRIVILFSIAQLRIKVILFSLKTQQQLLVPYGVSRQLDSSYRPFQYQ